METEIKWADGQAVIAESDIRWADGQPFVYYYEEAGGASIPRSNPFSRPFSQSLGRGGF
jgi:hypothetical protein